jgi:hypothetical protein
MHGDDVVVDAFFFQPVDDVQVRGEQMETVKRSIHGKRQGV